MKLNGQFIKDQADGSVEFEDKEGNVFQTEADASAAENITAQKKSKNIGISSRRNLNDGAEDDETVQPGTFCNGRLY